MSCRGSNERDHRHRASRPRPRPLRPRVLWALGVASLALLFLAPSALAADRVYWANSVPDTISFANLDGSGGGGQLSTAGATASNPFGVAIDPAAGRIYWANSGNSTISFANLDGSGGGQLSTAGATVAIPQGVAVDPAAGRIYWANGGNNTISFANLDGSGGGGELSTAGATPNDPSGVAIDPAAGRIYWANILNDTISFANLDGSGGGGQLSTGGATVSFPNGVAVDPAAGRIYWANSGNDTISFANLDGTGGGGQLSTAGATVDQPLGVAIDPVAGRIYWANSTMDTISFANLDGSGGGGQLSTAGATPSFPNFPALLRAPAGAGAPAVSGGGEIGQELSCGEGSWAADLLGSFLYRAPRSFAHQWRRDGADIDGATQATFTPTQPGEYSCRVTATNQAGSTSQTSAPRTVSETPTPPTPPTPQLEITGIDRDRAKGTATLTVATNLGGALRVAKTRKVKPHGPVELTEAGSAELEIVPRNRASERLERRGRVRVNPQVRFVPTVGGEIATRQRFALRQD